MKVIFLDVDGVLNTENNVRYHFANSMSVSSYYIELNQECMYRLQMLVNATKAKIVVSSSWRLGGFANSPAIKNLADQLANYGMYIYGFTPVIHNAYRGDEIREFIKWSEIPISAFVILDDDRDMCEYTRTHLVQCPSSTGFGDKELKRAMTILSKNDINIYNKLRSRAIRRMKHNEMQQ